jgi:hypothetical protein
MSGSLDRVALQVGVALVRWGRRPVDGAKGERRARTLERALARRECEARMEVLRDSVAVEYAVMLRHR